MPKAKRSLSRLAALGALGRCAAGGFPPALVETMSRAKGQVRYQLDWNTRQRMEVVRQQIYAIMGSGMAK